MVHLPIVYYHGKNFNLVTFGVFAALGSMAGYSIAFFYLYSNGFQIRESAWIVLCFLVFPNLVGAKFFSVFSTGYREFFKNLRDRLNETSFYQQGGVFGFIISGLCLFYLFRIPFFLLSDAICFGALATMFIGRLGCHNYGCCVGKKTQRKFGIIYSDPEAKICREVPEFQGIKLIPVQLIASGIDLFLFCLCGFITLFYSFSGIITIIFFFGVNLKRIVLQPYRWKDPSNRISYQWVSVILILLLLLCILFFYGSGEVIFKENNSKIPFVPITYFSFILTNYDILLPLLAGGAINFMAYGIHGKKLGTHINI